MPIVHLFLVFLKIGLFAIGGAYSFLPLLEREVVENYSWLTKTEFLDVLGAVGIFPGAISVKYASYVGYKIAGIPGVIAANLGNILGPMLLIILALGFYTKYKNLTVVKGAFHMVQLAVFAMIIAVAFKLININQLLYLRNLLVIVTCFILFAYTKIHPALIIISAGILGIFLK